MFTKPLAFLALLLATPVMAEGDGPGPNLVIEVSGAANGTVVIDPGQKIGAGDLAEPLKLTAGKKRHALVVLD